MAGLTDEEVTRQLDHMVAFINQEATERVQEIEARTEEEFNIEKGKLVQQERLRILNYYEKKEKQLSLITKITHSQCMNACRLEILKEQDDVLNEVFKYACEKLSLISKCNEYPKILSLLLLQALYQILESNVVVICRHEDKIIPSVVTEYENNTHQSISITIDSKRFLEPNCSGGLEVLNHDNSIRVDNSLDKRLELVNRKIMPTLRSMLFGPNKNRRHID